MKIRNILILGMASMLSLSACSLINKINEAFNSISATSSDTTSDSSIDEPRVFDGSYKLISEVGLPYNFVNQYERSESLLLGKSKYVGVQMGGVIYSEGMVMKSVFNMMTTTTEQMPAVAEFDVKNAFKYVTFRAGRQDKTAVASDKLNIYIDDVLKVTYDLDGITSVSYHQVDINNCRKLKFELVGKTDTYRGTFGIVDIAVHTDEVRDVEFDHISNKKRAAKDEYSSETTVKLMDDLVCYESFSGQNEQDLFTDDRTDLCEYTPFGGRTFSVGQNTYNTGVVLQTCVKYSLSGSGAVGMVLFGFYFGIFAGNDVCCNSLAAFNLRGKFKTLRFSVGPLAGKEANKNEVLTMLGDNGAITNYVVYGTAPITYELDVTGINTLIFYLNYSNGVSVPFGFYDMTVVS